MLQVSFIPSTAGAKALGMVTIKGLQILLKRLQYMKYYNLVMFRTFSPLRFAASCQKEICMYLFYHL
jgi:hypothetical protein